MSHRAIVAIQTAPDAYDIHYSANGAHELSLTALLEKHVAGHQADVDAVASAPANQLPLLKRWKASEKPPLNPTPIDSGVPLAELASTVNFGYIEAFYLVRDGGVETYVPVWMQPNIICPWREHLTVEVYRSNQVTSNLQTLLEELDATAPLRVIDEETFADRDWEADSLVLDLVTEFHEAVYALQAMMVEELSTDGSSPSDGAPDQSAESFISTGEFHLLIRGPSTEVIAPPSTGAGLLVRIPNEDMDFYWDVVQTADAIRVAQGARLNLPASVDEDTIREARTRLTTSLFKEYHTRIAPFSPAPFGPIAERLFGGNGDE